MPPWRSTSVFPACSRPPRSAASISSGRATPCWSTPTCCTATRPTRARRACACRRICSTAPSSPPLNCPSGATWPRWWSVRCWTRCPSFAKTPSIAPCWKRSTAPLRPPARKKTAMNWRFAGFSTARGRASTRWPCPSSARASPCPGWRRRGSSRCSASSANTTPRTSPRQTSPPAPGSANASASAASGRNWAPRRLPPSRTSACAEPPNCCARPTAPSATSPPPAALPHPATSARSFAAA